MRGWIADKIVRDSQMKSQLNHSDKHKDDELLNEIKNNPEIEEKKANRKSEKLLQHIFCVLCEAV